jgi:hypothetical protein
MILKIKITKYARIEFPKVKTIQEHSFSMLSNMRNDRYKI